MRAARRGEGSKKGLPDADILATMASGRSESKAGRARSQLTDDMRGRFCSLLVVSLHTFLVSSRALSVCTHSSRGAGHLFAAMQL